MERVLRQPDLSEVDALFAKAFGGMDGPKGGCVLFPVRHHSPACAYHLCEVIKLYKPDAILIEGPSDAGEVLPYLYAPVCVPPVCIYYSYDDREGLAGEDREKYRAYYPFLSYSPEWVALCKAKELNIDVSFIDLPYGARLVNSDRNTGTQYSYNENKEYEVNRYTAMLAKQEGCRSFSEFWESRYELDGPRRSTADFVRAVFALGYYMRKATPPEEWDPGDELREWHMAKKIAEAAKDHQRVLVVTGAFHVAGLLEALEQGVGERDLKPHSRENVNVYLMPYTFLEADSKTGYSAGMPFPAFYQSVWEKLSQKTAAKESKDPFGKTVLDFIIKTARYARQTQPVSLPDEINACAMTKSLAALRGKQSPGVYELLDGVRSAFVKGDINSTATFELDFLLRMLSGMGAGTVTARNCVPPVVMEFWASCRKYRLKTDTVEQQEVVLDLVKNPLHYEKSRFLHQLLFLETGYCKFVSGPDYVNGKDRNLIRETWLCHYWVQVETKLTDLSVYGSTLAQICASLIERKFRDSLTAAELGKLLLSVQVMGVQGFFHTYEDRIHAVATGEGNFVNLCKLLGSLRYLVNMQRLMDGQVQPELPALMGTVFRAATERVSMVRGVTADEEQEVCEQLRSLFALCQERPEWCDTRLFDLRIQECLEDGFCNSRFYGLCLAIEHKQGHLGEEAFCARISVWLESSMEQPEEAASFICGVFLAARDVLFADEAILTQLDGIVSVMDSERFLSVVPNLRYAFTSFLPMELERLGGMVAELHHASGEKLSGSMAVTEEALRLGMRLDALAMGQLKEWRLAE